MKYVEPTFTHAVEGDAYREGWERIFECQQTMTCLTHGLQVRCAKKRHPFDTDRDAEKHEATCAAGCTVYWY